MERERKLVSLCLIILFTSFIVVYSLLYQVKGQELLENMQGASNGALQMQTGNVPRESYKEVHTLDFGKQEESETSNILKLWVTNSNTLITGGDAPIVTSGTWQSASTDQIPHFEGDSPLILSWTDMYFGLVESFDKLGVVPKYILKDKKDIYYAYFSQEPKEISKVVRQLGGNIYRITTESQLVKNKLFGDKISYINLPEYQNKLVVMLVEVDGHYWLLQLPYKAYHQNKSYLKSLFIKNIW